MKAIPTDEVRQILVRATNWLGDAVMTTPALGTLRERFPAARITLLATPLVAELFSPHPWVDEVIVYDRKGRHRGIAGRFRIAAELKARRFDLAVLFPNSFDAALIAWLARVPGRLGYRTDGRSLLLTHGVPNKIRPTTEHQTRHYTAILDHWGLSSGVHPQLLSTTAAEDVKVGELLQDAGIGPADCLIGINPGATYGSAKRWYPERFAAVADELSARWGAKVVITGGPGETAIAADIAARLRAPHLNLAGRTGVRQLMAVIRRCNFFVTNDSGPMHIAAAFGVPLVAIFGSTDHTSTYPLAHHALVVRGSAECAPCLRRECPTDHSCMTAVTVEQVVSAAVQLREEVRVACAY